MGFYTCLLIVNSSKADGDFQKTLYKYLGPKGWSAGLIATIIIFVGAAIVYFVIQSQLLYPIVMAFVGWTSGKHIDLLPTSKIAVFAEFSPAWAGIL